MGKPEVNGLFGRLRHTLEDNIKTHLQEVELVAWTGLIWFRTGISGGLL